SPTLRMRQGEVIHSTIHSRVNTHTIHHHGMNATPFNDGVGHTSFEVNGRYTYQFQPKEAGTYFYHCHKNTVLHFEMGMYGLMIVDPPSGPGRVFEGGPRYDVEHAWILDDLDPRWREINHQGGQCGEDVGLDDFNPKYFVISGAFAPLTLTDPRAVVRAQAGQRILIRFLNASYGIVRGTLGVNARVVGVDGRGLGRPSAPWSRPIPIAAGQPFETTAAQRYDLLIDPLPPGTYNVRFEFLNWVTRKIQDNGRGVAETRIIVT
ncbi:MAG: multicopper oxidase domain-containing protein, partial [Hyphomonadaceae bacterium]|nr:multicopper oxidase domain-containing protein [Hyphomonadaceae bacterium]